MKSGSNKDNTIRVGFIHDIHRSLTIYIGTIELSLEDQYITVHLNGYINILLSQSIAWKDVQFVVD